MELKGKTILITGGTAGNGLEAKKAHFFAPGLKKKSQQIIFQSVGFLFCGEGGFAMSIF